MESLKKEIEKQIKQYSGELSNLKENRARECDSLNDAENQKYDDEIKFTARVVRGLKRIEALS